MEEYMKASGAVCFLLVLIFMVGICSSWSYAQSGPASFDQVFNRQRIDAYKKAIRYYNPSIGDPLAERISRAIITSAHRHGIEDDRFVASVITIESMFNPYAVSCSGAQGLGQLMPGTARDLNVSDSFNIEQNVDGACRYLKRQLTRYSHLPRQRQYELTLAAYNAGPGAVQRYGGIPPYQQTQEYVVKVIGVWRQLCGYGSYAGKSRGRSYQAASPRPAQKVKITRHYVYTTVEDSSIDE